MKIIHHMQPPNELISYFQAHWQSTRLAISGELIDLMQFPAIVLSDPSPVGILSYRFVKKTIEILSLTSEFPGQGIGSKLLESIESLAADHSCRSIHLVTTNDNLAALKFYQRRGYSLQALYPHAVEFGRLIKPEIPKEANGIPIKDELLLVKNLTGESEYFYRTEVFHVKPSITLQPFDTIQLSDLVRLFSDPKVFRFQAMQPMETLEEAQKYYIRVCQQIYQEKRLVRGIFVGENFAGIISLHHIQQDQCSLGYSLMPDYWKKGIATDAAITMIRIAFDLLHIRRIQAITHPDNIASIRLLERLRFHQEGTLIEYIKNPRTNSYENRETHALLAKNFR